MKDLSITQEFLMCALNSKGKLPVIGKEVPVCIVAGGIIELLQNNNIKLEGNKIIATKEAAYELSYLKSLYEEISKHNSVDIKNLISSYVMSLTDKKLNILIKDIGDELELKECVVKNNSGLFLKKDNFIPNEKYTDIIVEKIRAELLEDGRVTDEVIALVCLLDKSNLLKKYFSAYESKKLKNRLTEIKNTSQNELIKQMMEYVEILMATITAVIVSSSLN